MLSSAVMSITQSGTNQEGTDFRLGMANKNSSGVI